MLLSQVCFGCHVWARRRHRGWLFRPVHCALCVQACDTWSRLRNEVLITDPKNAIQGQGHLPGRYTSSNLVVNGKNLLPHASHVFRGLSMSQVHSPVDVPDRFDRGTDWAMGPLNKMTKWYRKHQKTICQYTALWRWTWRSLSNGTKWQQTEGMWWRKTTLEPCIIWGKVCLGWCNDPND